MSAYADAGIFEKAWLEWMGDGVYLGRGYWSELGFSMASLGAGVDVLGTSPADLNSHIMALLLWRFPAPMVGLLFVVSGTLSLLGAVLYFNRGHCIASRLCKFGGAGIGLFLWATIFAVILFVMRGHFAMTSMYGFGALSYLRLVHHGWRRF